MSINNRGSSLGLCDITQPRSWEWLDLRKGILFIGILKIHWVDFYHYRVDTKTPVARGALLDCSLFFFYISFRSAEALRGGSSVTAKKKQHWTATSADTRSGTQAAHPPPTTVWGARGRPFPRQRPRRRVDLKRPNRPAASAPPSRSWPSSRNEESRFTATRRGQTAKAFLPASNALSSLRSVTTTPRGLVCRTSSPSFFLGLAVGGCVRLSPSTVRPFATSRPRVRGHSRFSPAAYGPRAGHLLVQHFTLHQPKQGRRGLSFVVEGVTASRPSRHPTSGMSALPCWSSAGVFARDADSGGGCYHT